MKWALYSFGGLPEPKAPQASSQSKKRKMKKILLPPRLKGKRWALPPTNADREYCPPHPPLADYCICANGESLGEYTPRKVK